MATLLTFKGAVEADPAIDRWLNRQSPDLAPLATDWFRRIRDSGPDVRELMHDGLATVCVPLAEQWAPFAYVGAYKAHVNVGFFHATSLPDPAGLLEGTGKAMRHVKLRPDRRVDTDAVQALVDAAYRDIAQRLAGAR